VDTGVDVNECCSGGYVALHYACRDDRSIDIVRKLVESGANVNVMSSDGSCPLSVACESGSLEIARYLIENYADITIEDCFGNVALDYISDPEVKESLYALANMIAETILLK
jgi:ankyrin repeat protein